MANEKEGQRDLVVNDGEFAYVQDGTKGLIQTIVGPALYTPSQSDVPVIFDKERKRFRPCSNIEAIQPYVVADERSYIVLFNPANDTDKQPIHPDSGTAKFAKTLDHGSKIVVSGPVQFALWPRQLADVIPGHDLKSNQYLLARVYNAEEASKHWTLWPPAPEPLMGVDGKPLPEDKQPTPPERKLTIGQQLIVRGTEVSFFIPPTGIEVVKDPAGNYIRDALTLEALEYCILRDEDGNKRYEIGPAVVFPEPTETFVEVKDEKGNGHKKARAIELNELQGIHLKVIRDFFETPLRDYTEVIPDGQGTTVERHAGEKISRQAGEELFVTGAQTTIFYPSEELAFVKYDGRTKTFATTVPEGEARYVLNRLSGKIDLVVGPKMLLPDPRTHVIVRRALSDDQVILWYPDNKEALIYNRGLQDIASVAPTTRAGTLSEGDVERNLRGRAKQLLGRENIAASASVAMNFSPTGSIGESSRVSGDQKGAGDEFSRSSGYTAPRTIQLDTKYQGAVAVSVWTGYAILVVSKTGERRVVRGPTTVLLDYDETLEVLSLSTGKPKNTDNLLRTVYLRVENNKVSDIVEVETQDHVKVQLKLSYLVNFEGEQMKWFSVENYVKFMCDHARSVLKGAAQKIKIEPFWATPTDIIRDTLLGQPTGSGRPGMKFVENGMRIADVEVLGVNVVDQQVSKLLSDSQLLVVSTTIQLADAKRRLEVSKTQEQIAQEDAAAKAATQKYKNDLDLEVANSMLALSLGKLANELKEIAEKKTREMEMQNLADFVHESELDREKLTAEQEVEIERKHQDLEIAKISAETAAAVERFKAATGPFTQILTQLSDKSLMEKIAEATSLSSHIDNKDHIATLLQQAAGLKSISELVSRLGKVANGVSTTPATLPPAPAQAS